MIEGNCHCGAIRLALAQRPEKLTDCNCSACRRYRALWAHMPREAVRISVGGPVVRYSHGDRHLVFVTTNREPNGEQDDCGYLAVNAAMLAPEEIAETPIRRFDGAETWTYLD